MNIISSDSIKKTAIDLLLFYINNSNLEGGYNLLKENEIDLELKTNIGVTPLFLAVKNNNLTYTNMLLEFGADPNTIVDNKIGGESPLTLASSQGYFEIAELLLDYGADPNMQNNNGLFCLHLAAKNGDLNMVLLLITRGGDPNIRDINGYNASYYANKLNHLSLLDYLPPPEYVTPEILVDYKEIVMDKRFDVNADDMKKIRAQIGKDLKATQNKNKSKKK